MAFLKWSEKMSVGVPALDADHKKMVDLINGLSKTMTEGGSADEVRQAINALVDYARYHFEMEERLLKLTRYPALDDHLAIHKEMAEQINHFEALFKADPAHFDVIELYDLMSRWLMQHILHEDKKYKDHLINALNKNKKRTAAEA